MKTPGERPLPGQGKDASGSSDRYEGLGCVILASGLGRRFGGNKLMAPFRGKPLLAWTLAATEGIFFRRVVVTRHREVAQLCRSLGAEVLVHQLPNQSDTIRLGLEALGPAEGCLFCPGDQPLLTRQTVADLARLWAEDCSKICRPIAGQTPGAPVLFPGWAFPELMTLPPEAGGSYVIRRHRDRVAFLEVPARELLDADTPQALEQLESFA